MAARGKQVLKLYKELLREAGKFPGYMYRTYSLRRIKDAFRENKTESNSEKIDELLSYGRSNLNIIKRQRIKILDLEDVQYWKKTRLSPYITGTTRDTKTNKVIIGQLYGEPESVIEKHLQSRKAQ